MNIYADLLFGYAVHAYLKIGDEKPDLEGGQGDAMATIVFSATAAEVFINEVGALAVQDVKRLDSRDNITLFVRMWNELGARTSAKAKFILAKTILTDEPYDQQAQPFQDYATLLTLRDELLHMPKPEATYVDEGLIKTKPWQFVEEKLGPRNLLADCDPAVKGWLYRVTTKAMARWACETIEAMVKSLIRSTPQSMFGGSLDLFYFRQFSLPDSTSTSSTDSTPPASSQ
ncbi:MAG: hypothetical protein V3T84_14630 [Phycisphaerales bacterium]